MWLLPAQSRNNFLALDGAPPSPGACEVSGGECVCTELCRSGHGVGGQGDGSLRVPGGLGVHSAGEGVRGSCAEAACARREGGHGEHESLWGGCSAGAGDTLGWHMSAGVSAPFCVQRAVTGGRMEQPWADSHRGGPPEQRLSRAVARLGQGRPWVSEGYAHPWDNKG